ncbi:transcriptional regulator [Rhizobium laguerreae]|uniref:Transcriptional regulator n=1 Tax=Rhizobium laguerreae TaxID=1076926 RepID=A0AB35FG23_9HYPH|nr:winged helix-turn-helix domain-containing protein [Rhizobium laguerreae]MBY3064521.1 transcriptional regulator [Rhizobium laguerreae]
MEDAETSTVGNTTNFGPFQLIAPKRLLLRDQQPVTIGSRALDILILLVEHSGSVVTRRKIIDHVWPDLTVEDANLRVHIAGLRKALGDGLNGARYVTNVTGRGYCFVAPLSTSLGTTSDVAVSPAPTTATSVRGPRLPSRLARIIGRDGAISALTELVLSKRFVTVMGSGGLGKTTVAVISAHELLEAFDQAVFFIDFATIADESLVANAILSVVGVGPNSSDFLSDLIDAFCHRRVLLVLDNCEHVVNSVAGVAERLFADAPGVHLLTTSREALRVEGEFVFILQPLDTPPDHHEMTVGKVNSYSAVQLFMERAAASGYDTALAEGDVQTIVQLCRRLDGIPLAIELAASRMGTYGMTGTADLLDHSFRWQLRGRRNALPRHQTLEAMHDWSFNLLSNREREVLANLSVFRGQFTIEAARSVAGRSNLDFPEIDRALAGLVDKSLLATSTADGSTRFRLPETTRVYALMKLDEGEDKHGATKRHALYYLGLVNMPRTPSPNGNTSWSGLHIGNIRAALEWCFSHRGDADAGIELAARATPILLELGLLRECEEWAERGLSILGESHLGTEIELALQKSLAIASMFTRANGADVRAAIERGLSLAEVLGEREQQLDLLAGLHIFLTRLGDFHGSLQVATRSAEVATSIGGTASAAIARWMLGTSHHLVGDHIAARDHCEAGLQLFPTSMQQRFDVFGYNHRIRALAVLARTLWMRGLPDQAGTAACQAIAYAERLNRPADVCIALIYATTVLHWRGDEAAADSAISRLVALASDFTLGPYHAVGLALRAEHVVLYGELEVGIELLSAAISELRTKRHNVLMGHFNAVLARAHTRAGRIEIASELLEAALGAVLQGGSTYELPDLLRSKGEMLFAGGNLYVHEAEQVLLQAIRHADLQGAPSAGLQAAIPLAAHWLETGRRREAHALLTSIYDEFTEGFGTVDLCRAASLLRAAAHECTVAG